MLLVTGSLSLSCPYLVPSGHSSSAELYMCKTTTPTTYMYKPHLHISYSIYIACLIRPLIYSIFIGAFILGAGGGGKNVKSSFLLSLSLSLSLSHSVLWTAQGQILIQNSSKERMGTTSGIFWFMLESRYKDYSVLFN